MNVEYTLKKNVDELVAMLNLQDDVYMQARAIDISDAFDSVLYELLDAGERKKNRFQHVPKGVILFARNIKPSEALILRELEIAGLVTEDGSATSHIAIMARAWGIPMLTGVQDCAEKLGLTDKIIVLDCDNSCVVCDATEDEINHFREILKQKKLLEELFFADENIKNQVCKTADGIVLELQANISLPDELNDKKIAYASGIGLFRTEFLVLDKRKIPNENEQFAVYSELAKTMQERSVVIRTFDIGADKMIGEQEKLGEKNPMLGWRGVRYCLDKHKFFKTQLKAILRASVFGKIKILIPMVSTVEEILQVKEVIKEAKKELQLEGKDFVKNVPLGIMVEVPSVAIMAKNFAPYVDFISIGTNDLTQYVMAADRENVKVASFASYYNPAVLKLLADVIESGKYITSDLIQGSKISMCGEMASDEVAAVLLFAFGLRSFSMQPRKIPKMKEFFSKLTLDDAKRILAKTENMISAEKIRETVFNSLLEMKVL